MSIVQLRDVIAHRRSGAAEIQSLNSLSIEFREGDFSAILGPSGSSKTSLINAIAGIETVTSGQIIACGHDMTALDSIARAAVRSTDIGVVRSDCNLAAHLTIAQNLRLSHILSKREIDVDLYDDVVDRFDLREYLTKKPHHTSVDVHQRTAIARAVLTKPRLILADEPCSQLNSRETKRLMDCLRACTREYSLSVVLATHDTFAAAYADCVYLMLDGSFRGRIDTPTLQSIFLAQENIVEVNA